ncbi:MAG: hypothetical protein IMF05_03030 [Proteobacteria bacterium]|nr:hypothetical protein [Pseudomonadota bacterium]
MSKFSIDSKTLSEAFAGMRADNRKQTDYSLTLDRYETDVAKLTVEAYRRDPTISLIAIRRVLKAATDATKKLSKAKAEHKDG